MKHGTYKGPIQHLIGKTALLRDAAPGFVEAQFDDRTLTRSGIALRLVVCELVGQPEAMGQPEPPRDALGYGWHNFPKTEFNLDPLVLDEPV